jgi:succinate dehydrogenase hydrophobic anchor subunit
MSVRVAWEPVAPVAQQDAAASPRLLEYVLLRLTGLVLAVLVLGHFAVTHFVTDVAGDDSSFVARRLSSALWIAWDSAMLAAALAHGVAGVRIALLDYTGHIRRRLERATVALSLALFGIGVLAIVQVANG